MGGIGLARVVSGGIDFGLMIRMARALGFARKAAAG
jgi:hypothetical protein